MKKEFVKNTLYSTVGFGILILCNFVFNFFIARKMGAVDYGVFMAFFYLLIAFLMPINALQLAIAKYTTEKKLDTPKAIAAVTPTLFIFALIVIGLFGASSFFLKTFYHLPSIWEVIIGGGVIGVWIILTGYRGVYHGQMDFKTYGFSMGFDGVLRAGLVILFVMIGWHIAGAIGASAVSGVFMIFILIFKSRKDFLESFKKFSINKEIWHRYLKAFVVLLPFGLLMNIDLTIVQNVIGGKTELGSTVAGYIGACGLFGKNLISLAMVFANVVFSYTLKKVGKIFWVGVIMTVVVFGASAVFFVFFGDWIVHLLFGADYLKEVVFRGETFAVAKLLPWYILATIPLGIMQQAVNFSIAKDVRIIKILIWIFLVVAAPLFYFLLMSQPIIVFLQITTVVLFVMTVPLLIIVQYFSKKE